MGGLKLLAWLLVGISISSFVMAQLEPFGASVTDINTTKAPADTPGTDAAMAGNISQLGITGFSITQSWQGYFGNVTGTIVLADSGDNQLYNWTLANPEGEVYAANQTVVWTNIQCYNFTATGSFNNATDMPGGVSLNGTNLTQLESYYNIVASDVDGIDETFTLQHGGAGQHDLFFTANEQFSEGECISTRLYDSTGAGVSNNFEEVLLYDPAGRIPVFASLIEESSVSGFNDQDNDFEMLVLEDGHNSNIATTTYNFYVELE